jgi:hypothetical protein
MRSSCYLSVFEFSDLNQVPDFHENWYERYTVSTNNKMADLRNLFGANENSASWYGSCIMYDNRRSKKLKLQLRHFFKI